MFRQEIKCKETDRPFKGEDVKNKFFKCGYVSNPYGIYGHINRSIMIYDVQFCEENPNKTKSFQNIYFYICGHVRKKLGVFH